MTFFPPSRPRRVDGGIRSSTTRGTIGQSWWSRRFIDVLESFALGSRLTRGRSYARAGQVLSLEVLPGTVSAKVQGSRPSPYKVSIALAPFTELVWAKVEVALAEQALYSARLLAGEVPPELEEVFVGAGAPLFPRTVRELAMRCSCPDATVPCKHLAATFYLLAEAFDADPFQLLLWRGRARDALLTRLRTLRDGDSRGRGSKERAKPEPTAGPSPVGTAFALADIASLPLSADRFWLPPVALPARPPTLDTEADLLLRQLPEPGPGLGGADLIERLRPAYERFARLQA